MTQRDYEVELETDRVRYRARFSVDRGRILDFVVQLEVQHAGEWKPVVRYDTAHGFPHQDRYFKDGGVSKHEPLHVSDYKQAMTWALNDVSVNWRGWLAQFGEELP